MSKLTLEDKAGIGCFFTMVVMVFAWITHIFWVFSVLMSETYTTGMLVLAVIGAVIPPVGMLHGVYLWLIWTFGI